mmetsp:Transcript_7588/g.21729  ORF Transcript_7588/g.21729 Transcript_7588/m.21729 type:complete len:90 (-) Transcript_7588:38-307(-)
MHNRILSLSTDTVRETLGQLKGKEEVPVCQTLPCIAQHQRTAPVTNQEPRPSVSDHPSLQISVRVQKSTQRGRGKTSVRTPVDDRSYER